MLTSLYTAISGMNANGTSLSVIGDNIANLNTIGFKSSGVTFGDVLSQSLSGASGTSQIGRGVELTAVTPIFTQGSFQTTANGLDLAVDGDGFFMVNDAGSARFYTRAGQFSLDKTGNIVNPDGLVLQGYLADVAGNITGAIGDLTVAALQSPANATTSANVAVNLDASAANAAAWAFVPGATPPAAAQYNSSTTVTVYDSQGGAHPVNAYFSKTAANAWTAHYVYQDSAGLYQESATQALTFNTSGALTADNQAAKAFAWGGGVAAGSVTFNFGTSTAELGTGLDGTTQFNADFSVLNLNQNGYSAGSLQSVQVGQNGVITGVFTNGQSRAVGQVALGKFIAPTQLTKLGRNLYAESFDSGQPIVGMAGTLGLGKVLANSVELSNVDLAEEFVRMISSQRGFQANSRIITTTDQLMQDLVNLGR